MRHFQKHCGFKVPKRFVHDLSTVYKVTRGQQFVMEPFTSKKMTFFATDRVKSELGISKFFFSKKQIFEQKN